MHCIYDCNQVYEQTQHNLFFDEWNEPYVIRKKVTPYLSTHLNIPAAVRKLKQKN